MRPRCRSSRCKMASAHEQLAQMLEDERRHEADSKFREEARRRGYERKRYMTQEDVDRLREKALAADFGE